MSTTFADIEKLALELPVNERSKLADLLIAALPEDFVFDEQSKEAFQRSREMKANASKVNFNAMDELG